MSVQDITDTAIKHLYAGELLKKVALDVTALMEHMSDEQVQAVVQVRGLLLRYAQGELVVTQGLCEIAEKEQSKC